MNIPDNATYINPSQLCVGLYVHLDLGWMDHPFSFSSFKIKNQDQIHTIQQLGLQKIRYEQVKSDGQPLPETMLEMQPVSIADPAASLADSEILQEKKARIEQLNRIKAEIAAVEKKFQAAAESVRNISKNIHTKPQESLRAADELVSLMVEAMLTEGDVMIHAMNDKLGEDVYFHSLNVTVLSLMLAKTLGMSTEDTHHLGMGAMFHDIGKTEIPQKILMKTETLTKSEQTFLELHCEYGVDIAKKVGISKRAQEVVMQHHELVDGSGYPLKLVGTKMAPLAKIVSIVNFYDNLCNPVNLGDALTPYEALSQMFAFKRGKFEEAPLKAFIRSLGVYPPGSIVQLSNEMLGLVISVNPSKPLKPNVLVYDPGIPKDEAVIVNLDRDPDLNITKNLRAAQLPREVYQYLSPRKRTTYYFDPQQSGDAQ
ncbi:MAG: HD-GYP domain-containing protein [Sulfuricellaceae bacterium]|nr:HD-GYP domain-containing protein [Sulfuricellaceae bacterium]